MRLTSKGRYAVMALVDLARFDGINPVSLRDISLRQGISLDYLEQIFSKLRKKEIVRLKETEDYESEDRYQKSQYAKGLSNLCGVSICLI